MNPHATTFESAVSKTVRLRHWLYLPDEYDVSPARRWPLILYLHGAGERGDNPEAVRAIGLLPYVERQPGFPFVVVAPQCPAQSDWTLELDALAALLDHVLSLYRVDAHRVYLTGLSMGGRGVWQLAARQPHRFAAIAPICGRRPVWMFAPEEVCVLKELPVWVFHGARDDVIPPIESEFMVNALRACGRDVRYTLYPDADHDSWTRTYSNPDLYAWFLAHTGGEVE